MLHSPLVSIITVHYKVYNELVACIDSIYASSPQVYFEIIVVDNDEHQTIQKKLKTRYKNIRYIKSKNLGFGGGNNVGAAHAQGEFLFFLGPDTIVFPKTIDLLYRFLSANSAVGIVAPALKHENGKLFSLQGSQKLTPLTAIVCLSFINKYFPNNSISRTFFLKDWDKKTTKEVDVVPGTAFMIRKSLFEKICRFDENFFMYFEESDICNRVKKLKYSIYIYPKSMIIHLWERSTDKSKSMKIFKESRFYYFKKYYGLPVALAIEGFLALNKYIIMSIFLIGILFLFWYNRII